MRSASAERIFWLLDTKPEIQDKPDAVTMDSFRGEIEFKNVWFAYKEGEWVLRDVSFKINAKETVAFVGSTGSGKTTILSLICRNYDIQKGEILIDGINIKKIKVGMAYGNYHTGAPTLSFTIAYSFAKESKEKKGGNTEANTKQTTKQGTQ